MNEIAATELKPAWRDYLEMCKPRVILLMLLCTLAGMYLSTSGSVPVDLIISCLVGVALVAGSAAVVNHIADSHIDARMARTRDRPVADGRISNRQGLIFSAVIGTIGVFVLFHYVNPVTAWLNIASWVGYGLIYTLYLKRATPQNIVIGGLFGAAPPLFGWTAVTGNIELGGVLLVLIIFTWTPPHFWALALDRKDEYIKADVPMLPVTHGDVYTRWHILFYTIALLGVSIAPYFIGMSGLIYLVSASILGGIFLYWAIRLIVNDSPATAMQTFRYSILYLALLFIFLLIDHYYLI
ncbi:MAG: heme o synthase [Pseudomonadales bacterium]|nr:heme o synthase [Pseudomonadales bacterium]